MARTAERLTVLHRSTASRPDLIMKLCGDAQLGFRRGEACDFTAPNARIASNYLTRCQPDQTSYRAIIPPHLLEALAGPGATYWRSCRSIYRRNCGTSLSPKSAAAATAS